MAKKTEIKICATCSGDCYWHGFYVSRGMVFGQDKTSWFVATNLTPNGLIVYRPTAEYRRPDKYNPTEEKDIQWEKSYIRDFSSNSWGAYVYTFLNRPTPAPNNKPKTEIAKPTPTPINKSICKKGGVGSHKYLDYFRMLKSESTFTN